MIMSKIWKTNGSVSSKKIGALIVGALITTLIGFSINTGYARYSWMRDQAYKVATNENLAREFKTNSEKKDVELDKKLDDFRAEMKKSIGTLHQLRSKETDKREHVDERIMDLVVRMLQQQQKQVEIQQKQMSK